MEHIETERRFLIEMPEAPLLEALGGDRIEQIYIESEPEATARVRRREGHGKATYTHTVKRRIGTISSAEDERAIGEDEYRTLAKRREDGTHPVIKTRYVLPYRGHNFEIDVYPEWAHVAVMEVELASEDEEVALPPELTVIKEVSGERRLSNHALSRRMPDEGELL